MAKFHGFFIVFYGRVFLLSTWKILYARTARTDSSVLNLHFLNVFYAKKVDVNIRYIYTDSKVH